MVSAMSSSELLDACSGAATIRDMRSQRIPVSLFDEGSELMGILHAVQAEILACVQLDPSAMVKPSVAHLNDTALKAADAAQSMEDTMFQLLLALIPCFHPETKDLKVRLTALRAPKYLLRLVSLTRGRQSSVGRASSDLSLIHI